MSENNAKSDLLKAYKKKNARGPAVKVNPQGGRGTEFILEAIK